MVLWLMHIHDLKLAHTDATDAREIYCILLVTIAEKQRFLVCKPIWHLGVNFELGLQLFGFTQLKYFSMKHYHGHL